MLLLMHCTGVYFWWVSNFVLRWAHRVSAMVLFLRNKIFHTIFFSPPSLLLLLLLLLFSLTNYPSICVKVGSQLKDRKQSSLFSSWFLCRRFPWQIGAREASLMFQLTEIRIAVVSKTVQMPTVWRLFLPNSIAFTGPLLEGFLSGICVFLGFFLGDLT